MNSSGDSNPLGSIGRRLVARLGVLGLVASMVVLSGAVALAWAVAPFSAGKSGAKVLKLKAAPKSATVTAGGKATFTLTVKPVSGRPKISATGLPAGAAASYKTKLGKTKTAPAKVTMTVSTGASTPAGTYALKLKGKSGSAKGAATLSLTVQRAAAPTVGAPAPPPAAASAEPPPSDRVFAATATVQAQLVPGAPQKLDLLIQNLTAVEISVQSLAVAFEKVEGNAIAAATPCGAVDFAFTQLAGPLGGKIPAGGSRRLSELGVPDAGMPTVQLANRNANQDGCQNAQATVRVTGTATGANWTGNGSGSVNAAIGSPQQLSLAPAAPRGQLAPGGSVSVDVTVTNPNAFPMHVTSLRLDTAAGTAGFAVDAAHAGCNLAALHLPPQTNGGAGWDVPPRVGAADGSRTIELTNALSMDDNAENACQGATFTVNLKGGN